MADAVESFELERKQDEFNSNFYMCLFALAVVCGLAVKRHSSEDKVVVSGGIFFSNHTLFCCVVADYFPMVTDNFKKFQRKFLIAHSIAMFADWLQVLFY